MTDPVIEYFYSTHSAFAYLGSARFREIAGCAGRRIVHRPYDLDAGMAAAGSTGFRARPRNHRLYFFKREIERWAEERGVVFMSGRPSHHDNDYGLANRMVIAAAETGADADGLSHALSQAHWRDDADLADQATLEAAARDAGIDPEPLLAAAATPQIASRYAGNTEEAIARSVFGSPTYFVDGDMFYGQDRLEMVARALERPYRGQWPLT
jgi:2-hydroxychromene-2-carboxylate isomerase